MLIDFPTPWPDCDIAFGCVGFHPTLHVSERHVSMITPEGPHLFEPAFNGGLLAFKLGEFQDSFELANKALEAYPDHIESKSWPS